MQTIRDLLSRDLSQPIEEVIKLDQQDEKTVYTEITEYVATDRIKRQYRELLQAIADAPGDPTEGVGVWISGFFGSGKSSFAKNLGYILSNRKVLGHPAAQLFVQQLQEQSPGDPLVGRIADTVNFINTRFDAHVIMFDVQMDRAVRRATEPIAEIMYTVLLRELDYAQDYDVAELEIELEAEGRLGDFVRACAETLGEQVGEGMPAESLPLTLTDVPSEAYAIWRQVRKGAQRIQRASAVLHEIDPGIPKFYELFDPRVSALSAVSALKKKGCDLIVALSYQGWPQSLELARSVEGIDIVINGRREHNRPTGETTGRTTVVDTGIKRISLTEVLVEWKGGVPRINVIESGPEAKKMKGRKDLLELEKRYQAELRSRGIKDQRLAD